MRFTLLKGLILGNPAEFNYDRGRGKLSDVPVSTWAAFSGRDDNAALDGNLALTADEVQLVLREVAA